MDVIHVNAALLSSSHALHALGSTNLITTRETVLKGCKMMTQESYYETNYINHIALTNIVPGLLKFKSSNCRN